MSRRSSSSSWPVPERRALVLLVLAFVLALPGVTLRIYASDEIQFFSYLRSLWFDRDVEFENEYRHFYDQGTAADDLFHETFLERTSPTGLRLNFGTIGSGLLWSPFYAVADLSVRLARAGGSPIPADGHAWPYVAAVCWGSALYGLLALVCSWAGARHVLRGVGLRSHPPAVAAVWAVWLGTPLLFYMYVAPVMSHAPSAFGVACFVLVWLRVRDRYTIAGLAALGALAALMAMLREQDVLFALGPAVDLVWRAWTTRQWRRLTGVAAAVATFTIVFLPQAMSYLVLNGRIGPSQVTSRKMAWSSPHAWEALASPEHGFFLWTPIAILAVAGLFVLFVRPGPRDLGTPEAPAPAEARRLATSLLVMLAAQVYIVGSVESWTLAGAFGQRRFVSLTPLLVIGLAVLLARARTSLGRVMLVTVSVIAVWWNIGLMVQFGAGLMDRQRLDLAANTYNTFVTVPRVLPAVAWRYVFDRGSFYRRPTPSDDPGRR
ncbi:MAG: hypothetical protein AB1806_14470 [Acidobacteriota bacterium]